MTASAIIGRHVAHALVTAEAIEAPYRHWRVADVLPTPTAGKIIRLPVEPAAIGDTAGKRETHNSQRVFFSEANRAAHPVCAQIAQLFQDRATIEQLHAVTGADLAGSFLRIEYCQDTDGFWLEPHTDIGAKLFTMLVYLSTDPRAEGWGTDLYDRHRTHLGAAPGGFNRGLIFIPAADTWHGFERRPIAGVRKSIIINYVKPEWRSRHELAFPNDPIAA